MIPDADESPGPSPTPAPTIPDLPASVRVGASSRDGVLQAAAREIEAMKRLIEPSIGESLIRRDIERHGLLAQHLQAPVLPKLAVNLEPLSGLKSQFDRIGDLMSAYESPILEALRAQETVTGSLRKQLDRLVSPQLSTFRMPALVDPNDVLGSSGAVSKWLQGEADRRNDALSRLRIEHLQPDRLASALSKLSAPWIKVKQELDSVRAMVELSSIGTALRQVHPFDLGFTEALRKDLGDWRNAPNAGPRVWAEPSQRTRYYVEQGFDASLTDFPDRAFSEGLFEAELCDDYLADLDLDKQIPDSDPETEIALRHCAQCQNAITRLELELRKFIDDVMQAQFGPDWIHSQVKDEVRQGWVAKAEKAAKLGREARLIDFVDFTEYEDIICRRDSFAKAFRPYFGSIESVRESFRRLRPLRLDAMHSRPQLITKDDVLLVVLEARRLIHAMRLQPQL